MSNTDQHHHELTDLFTGISQTVNDTRVYQTRDVNTLYTFPWLYQSRMDGESRGTPRTYFGQQRIDPDARENTAERACLRAD